MNTINKVLVLAGLFLLPVMVLETQINAAMILLLYGAVMWSVFITKEIMTKTTKKTQPSTGGLN